jgi:uroporphyrinogen-III synthase
MAGLEGRTIAFLEARRSREMASLVERQGGTPYIAPALREVPTADSPEVRDWIERLVSHEFDLVLFLTGVGCHTLLDAAASAGKLDSALRALDQTRVIARGPKPVHVLKQHGVRIDFVPPEPNTSDELLQELSSWDLTGKQLGLQVYGGSTPFLERLLAGLDRLGARVHPVAPYRWERPVDEGALRDLIDACVSGRIDALAILSSSQIHNLFAVAEEHDASAALTAALNSPRILVAAVGPVAAQALEEHGVRVGLQPEHPKMGHLVLAIANTLQDRSQPVAPEVP